MLSRKLGIRGSPNFLAKAANVILYVDPKSSKIMEEKGKFAKPLI